MKNPGFKNPAFQMLANTLPYDYEMVKKVCIIFKDMKAAESFLIYCFRKHVDPIDQLNTLKDAIRIVTPVADLAGVTFEEMIAVFMELEN